MKATGRVAFETLAGVWAYFYVPYLGEPAKPVFTKIAVKRPAYGCLRCFRLSEAETCTGCGGLCEEILDELNSALPKET